MTHTRLMELARGGEIDPRRDLVWSRGMLDWSPAGEVEGLFPRRVVAAAAPPVEEMPRIAPEAAQPQSRQVDSWKGTPSPTGRFRYVVGTVLMPVLLSAGISLASQAISSAVGPKAGVLVMVLFILVPAIVISSTIGRLRNLGMSGWWLLGFLVPPLNLWLGYRCLACPPDYARLKKLDGAGWLLALLYWLPILAVVGFMGWTMYQQGRLPDIQQWLEEHKPKK